MQNLKNILITKFKGIFCIEEPPYDYNFIMEMPEKEYAKYLKKIFKMNCGYDLNLRKPKTFNEKIQWLKLYDNLPIKTTLTDKVLVRDWVKERIGETYLKPVFAVYDKFDDIEFDKLPQKFFIKANHGCRWHFYIKNKDAFLNSNELYNYIKFKFDNWLSQSFFGFSAFETQYKNIVPKLFIEEALVDDTDKKPVEFEVFCYDGEVRLIRKIRLGSPDSQSFYSNELKLVWQPVPPNEEEETVFLPEVLNLSRKLADKFKLVRIDWLVFKNKLYFNELTFTPYSGMVNFNDKNLESNLNKHFKI